MSTPTSRDEKKPLDLILPHRAHRQLIGLMGIMLPVLVVVISWLWPTPDVPWKMLASISEFYYTSATAVFVGSLFTLALFLFTYGGYEGDLADRALGKVSGFAALGVAFFPTKAPSQYTAPPWWLEWMGTAHYTFAVLLFLSFIAFALWIFRRTSVIDKNSMPTEKRWRNRISSVCGGLMIVSIVWAAIALKLDKPIFLPEATALVAFAISWLVKGRIHEPMIAACRRIIGLVAKRSG